jgi:L-asparagine transporter-like permease
MTFCCIVNESDSNDPILMFPALLTYINFVSVKLFVRVQNVFTISKLLACVIIIVSGVYAICAGKVVLFLFQEHKASCLGTV